MSSADIVYPLLIAVGCIGLAVVVHLLTRPKPSRSDIAVPDSGPMPAPTRQAGELGAWHRMHEDALASFVEAIDDAAEIIGSHLANIFTASKLRFQTVRLNCH